MKILYLDVKLILVATWLCGYQRRRMFEYSPKARIRSISHMAGEMMQLQPTHVPLHFTRNVHDDLL